MDFPVVFFKRERSDVENVFFPAVTASTLKSVVFSSTLSVCCMVCFLLNHLFYYSSEWSWGVIYKNIAITKCVTTPQE